VFDRRMIEQCVMTGVGIGALAFGLFTWLHRIADYDAGAARNLTLLFMVSYSNLHVLNCRSETRSVFRIPLKANPLLVAGVIGAQALHIAAMHVPLLQSVLGLRPVSLGEWLGVLGLASVVIVIGETYKLLRARPLARREALTQDGAAAGA
jgi:magnesium-transporting ATPase (P-type)